MLVYITKKPPVVKGSRIRPYDNRCEAKIDKNPERDGVIFYGRGVDGKPIQIITRLDDKGNIYADLTEVTVVDAGKKKNLPPPRPLTEVVRTVANRRQRGGLLTADVNSVPQTDSSDNGGIMLEVPQNFFRWRGVAEARAVLSQIQEKKVAFRV